MSQEPQPDCLRKHSERGDDKKSICTNSAGPPPVLRAVMRNVCHCKCRKSVQNPEDWASGIRLSSQRSACPRGRGRGHCSRSRLSQIALTDQAASVSSPKTCSRQPLPVCVGHIKWKLCVVLALLRFILTVWVQPWHLGSSHVTLLLWYLAAILGFHAGLPYDFEDTLK